MAKIENISGFPEWLPEGKLLEEKVIDRIREVYRLYGFTPIETPAVELYSTLAAKGVVDKELYVLRRAQAEGDQEAQLALHFDLTVPLARFVSQHLNDLVFPFKRYQVQKVWRGDRPQRGRMREFYQFDIDTIARDELPIACDAEVLSAFDRVYRELGGALLGLGGHTIRVNDRRILRGLYASLGLNAEQQGETIRIVDKLDKIGVAGVKQELSQAGFSSSVIERIAEYTTMRMSAEHFADKIQTLGVSDELFARGVEDLSQIFRLLGAETRSRVWVDLSLARGLDYYTGIVIEATLDDHPEYRSVGGGGRYDDLCGDFVKRKLPGVGVSIGLSRIMDLALQKKLVPTVRRSPMQVLVALYSEEQALRCHAVASEVRSYGVACAAYPRAQKLGKQLEYAVALGIPYVIFVDSESGAVDVKVLETKQQQRIEDLRQWCQQVRDEQK